MQDIETLENLAQNATVAYENLKRVHDEKAYDLKREAERKIDAELQAEFGEQLTALYRAMLDAKDQLRDGKDRIARIGEGGFAKPGERFVEWNRRWPSSPLTKTGRVGIVECVTKDSRFSERLSNWRAPSIGSFIIRFLKKDGTPSANFIAGTTGSKTGAPWGWHPEGVDPNQAKEQP